MTVDESVIILSADPASADCRSMIRELDALQESLYSSEYNYLDSFHNCGRKNNHILDLGFVRWMHSKDRGDPGNNKINKTIVRLLNYLRHLCDTLLKNPKMIPFILRNFPLLFLNVKPGHRYEDHE